MKINLRSSNGSILIITLMTIMIMTLICATTLYITSQNTSTAVQTGAWQQALTGAEAGIDAAVRALNQNSTTGANAWTNWKTVSTATLPTKEPSGGTGSTASAPPTTTQYNYLPSSSLNISYPNTEGTTAVSAWVTIDTAGGITDSTGSWYRIRSTGQAVFQSNSVYKRVSNNRLDNDLRNTLGLNFNRKGGSNLGPTRTIEVIVQPVPKGSGGRGITLANWLAMTGGGTVDAFNSPNGQWSSTYRDTSYPQLVAEGKTDNNAKFANAGQTYVYGGVVYSGNPPTNINAKKDILGQVSTPDTATISPTSDPSSVGSTYNWGYINPWTGNTSNYSWDLTGNGNSLAAGHYMTYQGNGTSLPTSGSGSGTTILTSVTAVGTASSPGMIVINGSFTCPKGATFNINASTTGNPPVTDSSNSYLVIWVKGSFTTSGSSILTQAAGTHVTWIVDGDITTSGDSYVNPSGYAMNNVFVQVGDHKFTVSGQAGFTGIINAPRGSGTISGQGDFTGAIVGSNLTISGSGSFHYDESLGGTSNPLIGNYAFASWFEDNSDPTHKDVNGNYVVY